MSPRGAVALLVATAVAVALAAVTVVLARVGTSHDTASMVGVVSQVDPEVCVARDRARGDCFRSAATVVAQVDAGDCVRATYRTSDRRLVSVHRVPRSTAPEDCPVDYVPPHRDGDPAGCALQDLSERPRRSAAETGPIAGAHPDAGRVCAYDKGRLVGSRQLTAQQAVDLATAVRAGPDGVGPGGLGCPMSYDYPEAYAEPHFTARLTYGDRLAPTDLWVFGNVCLPSGVANQDGRFLRLTDRLTGLLARLVRTPSPFPLTDPALPPGAVPTGPLTPAECPSGVVDGLPRWYGEKPVARAYGHRLATLTAPIRRAHPDARLESAGFVGDVGEQAWLLPDNSRVGRVVSVRGADSGGELREWEWC